ncbi:MAG: isochorismatase family protein [Anaerolineales bacterium]|nr:isochorismatase family protein [Anaerolineales bacterium]
METSENTPSTKNNHHSVALLVIDVQQGLFEKSTPIYKADELLQNITVLIARAHLNNAPVVYVQHSDTRALVKDSAAWQLHPQLHPLNTDTIIHKRHGNAFEDTLLEKTLRVRGVTTVVVTGLVTHGCVRATCIGAQELGFNVILVQDGHSSFNKQAAKLIEEWNEKLSAMQIEVKPTSEVIFNNG